MSDASGVFPEIRKQIKTYHKVRNKSVLLIRVGLELSSGLRLSKNNLDDNPYPNWTTAGS